MSKIFTLIFLSLTASSALASTVTFDFEDGALEKDGFHISYEIDPEFPGAVNSNGTAHFYNVNITLERMDGGLFTLHSYDYTGMPVHFGFCARSGVTGTTLSGDSLLQPSSSHSCGTGWETQALGPEWTSLSSVTFLSVNGDNPYSEGHVDNIVVSNVVPVPATIWLFGSALAGLGWLRRKQTA